MPLSFLLLLFFSIAHFWEVQCGNVVKLKLRIIDSNAANDCPKMQFMRGIRSTATKTATITTSNHSPLTNEWTNLAFMLLFKRVLINSDYPLSKVNLCKFLAFCVWRIELLTARISIISSTTATTATADDWRSQWQQRIFVLRSLQCNKLRLWGTYWFTTFFSSFGYMLRWLWCLEMLREPIELDRRVK